MTCTILVLSWSHPDVRHSVLKESAPSSPVRLIFGQPLPTLLPLSLLCASASFRDVMRFWWLSQGKWLVRERLLQDSSLLCPGRGPASNTARRRKCRDPVGVLPPIIIPLIRATAISIAMAVSLPICMKYTLKLRVETTAARTHFLFARTTVTTVVTQMTEFSQAGVLAVATQRKQRENESVELASHMFDRFLTDSTNAARESDEVRRFLRSDAPQRKADHSLG